MKSLSYTRLIFSGLIMGIMLAGCGDDESGKATTQASSSKSEPMPMKSEAKPAAQALEDNGVVYEEEIYKNWPYN